MAHQPRYTLKWGAYSVCMSNFFVVQSRFPPIFPRPISHLSINVNLLKSKKTRSKKKAARERGKDKNADETCNVSSNGKRSRRWRLVPSSPLPLMLSTHSRTFFSPSSSFSVTVTIFVCHCRVDVKLQTFILLHLYVYNENRISMLRILSKHHPPIAK